MERIKTGVAYHGNRILKHVAEDMAELARNNMDIVVHMFSHNDWDRHLGVMKEMCNISEYYGLEVWIDNWGLGGPPGDKSHFLQYHPEAHQVFSDGTVEPVRSCYNNPAFVDFTKSWIETVKGFGGKKIFWDEPHLREKNGNFTCCCPTCKKLFEERYNKPMPTTVTEEVADFRKWTLFNYFNTVCTYAADMGIENSAGIMIHTLDYARELMKLRALHDFGIDPYWQPRSGKLDPYDYVYTETQKIVTETAKVGKKNHLWIQGYDIPAGHEDEIIVATDAAYDAGARTLINWGYRGSESNTYKSDKCDRTWAAMCQAFERVRNRHFDAIREEKLRNLGKL